MQVHYMMRQKSREGYAGCNRFVLKGMKRFFKREAMFFLMRQKMGIKKDMD